MPRYYGFISAVPLLCLALSGSAAIVVSLGPVSNYSISLSGYAAIIYRDAVLPYVITESFHPGICSSNYYYLYRVQECFATAVFHSLGLSSILTSWDQQRIFLTPDTAGPRAMPLRTVFAGTSSNYFSSTSDQKELFTAMLSRIQQQIIITTLFRFQQCNAIAVLFDDPGSLAAIIFWSSSAEPLLTGRDKYRDAVPGPAVPQHCSMYSPS